MFDRETIEITLAITASGLLIISEALALSKKSDCNSVSEFVVNAIGVIRRHLRPGTVRLRRPQQTENEPPTDRANDVSV